MKNSIDISVGGISFVFESDAYELLSNYLKEVETALGSESESKEIIADIESRIAELILSQLKTSSSVVNASIIKPIIEQMGIPEGESKQSSNSTQQESEEPKFEGKKSDTKRLYRKLEGAKLGGVMNGIAAYLDIDVTIARVLTFIPYVACIGDRGIFSEVSMFIIFIYCIAWAAIPAAKNARQKMEMEGRPITASTLKGGIKNNLDDIHPNEKNSRTASFITDIFYFLGKLVRITLVVVSIFIISILLLSLIGIIAGTGVVLSGYRDIIALFIDSNPFTTILILCISLLIPLLLLIYVVAKMVFSYRWNNTIIIIFSILWICSWGTMAMLVVTNLAELAAEGEIKEEYNVEVIDNQIGLMPLESRQLGWDFDIDESTIYSKTSLRIELDKTLSDTMAEFIVVKQSRGLSVNDAIENCENIRFEYSIDSSIISYDAIMAVTEKYRKQDIDMTLKVSPSTCIVVPKSLYHKYKIFSSRDFYNERGDKTITITPEALKKRRKEELKEAKETKKHD